MKKHVLIAAGLAFAGAGSLQAQGLSAPVCPNSTTSQQYAQDACQQAYDLYQFLAPQLGLAVAGGNATLGSASTQGGLGHFSVGIRGNFFPGYIPDVGAFSSRNTGASPARTLPSKHQLLGAPIADAAIGIFKGLPLGLTNVGGVDLLLSATYIPTIDASSVKITPDQNLQLGYGVRIGLLQESILVPGVSFSYLKRDLPTTTIIGTSSGQSLNINNAKVKTDAWRLTASKNLLLLNLAAGVGQDHYKSSADIVATVSGSTTVGGVTVPYNGTSTIPDTRQSLTRTNAFLDAALAVPFVKLVGEVGYATGGTVDTYNSFSTGRADKGQVYFSAGLRFGL